MLRYHIANMECSGCEKGVRATLAEAVPGARVHVALAPREVSVESADAARIEAALRNAGWDARRVAA
ncbi:heavy-metal-associated domain-containing protein [Leptolyngbya sp. 15MV]|jgi:copper chaperone|nr:heavy-metal-associated domain-containing protein [Leptolyngbya sp. 15MV]